MPQTQYLEVLIGEESVEIPSAAELPLAINYKVEEPEDFQRRTSDTAFNIKFPATVTNSRVANSYHNPGIEDLTPGQQSRNHRPALINGNGIQLLKGKAFLKTATHGRSPESYEFSFYGGNGDWIVDLKEKTIYDFLQDLTFLFTVSNIMDSWDFDGTDEDLIYVFAPAKYRGFMDVFTDSDANVDPSYMRPSLSVYWIIQRAFKSLGYRVQSDFFNTAYFRRMVLPWIWGNFLDSDGTKLQIHKFLAKSTGETWLENLTGDISLSVTNDSTDGAYDNNNEYSFNTSPNRMEWEYKVPDFGSLDATFSCQVSNNCTLVGSNSYCHYYLKWYHFDVSAGTTTLFKTEAMIYASGHDLGRRDIVEIKTFFATHNVQIGDKIYCVTNIDIHEGKGIGARANNISEVLAFQLEYFRIPIGGTINFENYVGLKKHKFLDFLGGICDLFDLIPTTDPVSKIVTFEPSHPYSLTDDLGTKSGGYYNGNTLDWTDKKDFAKSSWQLDLYSESEKELLFKFKDDSNDGILKVLQDRNLNTMAMGKYVLPDRFKAGKKEIENRFFAAATHYDVPQMKDITGVEPQFMCFIPENISNTSNSEAANTFVPKIAYYKGDVSGVGGWKFAGSNRTTLPFMFAVNYKAGGEDDPVLSYGDERVGTNTIAKGLLKRFYWQRMAIMRNGQYYGNANFLLNHNDVSRQGHREFKTVDGLNYLLIEIKGYEPLKDESTVCMMRKWSPITADEFNNTYPSADALALPVQPPVGNDIKYAQLKCLISDIPTTL